MQFNLTLTPRIKGVHILGLTSCTTVLILAYIDEGYYDFAWMADIGNWIAVAMFAGGLFLLQWGIYTLSLRIFKVHNALLMGVLTSAFTIFILVPTLFAILQSVIKLFIR